MSLQQLVGSVLVFGFHGGSFDEPETREEIEQLKAIHCGGVILFDHDIAGNCPRNIQSPRQLAKLIEDLKNELGSSLIIAIDQEGGSVARLNEHNGFLPTVSAAKFKEMLPVDQVQYTDKQAIQLAKLGINLNFAPCVDLAITPDSPIIAGKERAFGKTIEEVVCCAHIVVDAHTRSGVRCCVKHFPGHGSSLLDSHKNICDITNSHTDEETNVFENLIAHYDNQIAVMSGHLIHTKIDSVFPASLSPSHTNKLLRNNLGFDGVVVTDSLDMRAIRDNFGEGESAVLAINAGADLVLDGLNAPGFREPGAPVRIAQAIFQAVKQEKIADGEHRLIQSRDRISKLMKAQ